MAKVRGAAAEGRGGGRCGGSGGRKTEAGIGLFARTGGLVEDGTVDFGDNDVVAAQRVEI